MEIDAFFEGALRYARTAERLRATLTSLTPVLEAVGSLHELEPALAPELVTVLTNLEEANKAIIRASAFLDARFEVVLAEVQKTYGITPNTPEEGGPHA